MKIIKTLELVGDDKIHPTDGTMYYPGVATQLTTDTQGFPEECVFVMSEAGGCEPVAFTLDEAKAMHGYLGDIIYNREGGEW